MRNPRLTSKRVLSAFLVAGLAATAIVSMATSSNAATVPAMTLTPSSGATVGGDTLQIKGKGFVDSNNDSTVKDVIFSTGACADGIPSAAAGYVDLTIAGLTVASATKAVLVVPAVTLPAGSGYICFFDHTTGVTGVVLGSSKYTVGVKPAILSVNGALESGSANVISASTFGGTPLTFTGTGFTKTTYISVGGTKATTKYVSATSLTATMPPGTAGTGKVIKVTSEFGSFAATTNTVTYLGTAKVTPISGAPSTAVGVTLTGSGFNSLTFGTSTSQYVVQFTLSGTAVAAGAVTGITALLCTNIVVESDTVLTCKTPATLQGPYSVQILQRDATTASTVGAITTVVSRLSTYTAAAF